MRKMLVILTSLCAVTFLTVACIWQKERLPDKMTVNIAGQPVVGSGGVELILFEDLTCIHCRIFGSTILPQIAAKWIDTGKAYFVFIPVAFDESSLPHANAALAVYTHARQRFIPFLIHLLKSHPKTVEEILAVAEFVGGIDQEVVARAMEEHLFDARIHQNLELAQNLIGEEFGTPLLLVNGFVTSTSSFAEIARRIKKVL